MPYRTFTRISDGKRFALLVGSAGVFNVPEAAHIQNVADAYGEDPSNIRLEEVDSPPDLTEALPTPVTPLSTDDQERMDAQGLKLPSFAQIEQAVAAISNLADAKVFLARLAKIVRVLAKNQL